MNRTDRLLALVLELQAKGWQRAEDLGETFEVSKRTIYRDMLALMESGVPVVSSPGQGYSLVEGYFLPPLSFSVDEAVVLLLGSDYMNQNFDAQYQAAANSSSKKIRAVLNEKLRDEVDDLQQRMRFVSINPLLGSAKPETLQQLRRAVIQSKQARLQYHSRHGETQGESTRVVDPYGLAHVDKAWYLIAYCHLRQDIRRFRLDRIDHLQILNTAFQRPNQFDFQIRLDEDREVLVRALFSPDIARWVKEERLFFIVDQEERPDGLLVTFQVRHEDDLFTWMLGWGAKAHVIEPASLRQRIIDESRRILQHYEGSESLLP